MILRLTGPTTATTPVIGLAIPEDDTTPDAPLVAIPQGDFKTQHPHLTTSADHLGLGQFGCPSEKKSS